MTPLLTLAAGLAHAVAGAITGPRVISGTRAQAQTRACLIGGGTSLLAVLMFAPFFALWLSAANARPEGPISFVVMTLLVGVFSFLGAGWPLLFVSAGVGWGLYRLADRPASD